MMYPSNYDLKSPIELLIMLTIQNEKEIHGFELIKKLDRFKNWTPQAGTIYPILERLNGRGFLEKIETTEGSARKKALYRLNKKGLEVLNGTLEIIEDRMDFYETIFDIAENILVDDSKIIDFIQKRFKTYFELIGKRSFENSPENILKLSQFYDFFNENLKILENKLGKLKEEGNFVKIDIK